MPGLKLTLAQAARVFGLKAGESKRLLEKLTGDGFLVCDTRGAYRRRDSAIQGPYAIQTTSKEPLPDLLDTVGVELPCLVCHGSYNVSLSEIRLSQLMMDAGCQVRHFADCSPAAVAHLINPAVLAEFETAVRDIASAAEGAGGRLVRTK